MSHISTQLVTNESWESLCDFYDSAMKQAVKFSSLSFFHRVSIDKKIPGDVRRLRNRGARQLDALTKEIAVPLGQYMKGFPVFKRLHPFEQALLSLTLGDGVYERTLAQVDTLRKTALEVGF